MNPIFCFVLSGFGVILDANWGFRSVCQQGELIQTLESVFAPPPLGGKLGISLYIYLELPTFIGTSKKDFFSIFQCQFSFIFCNYKNVLFLYPFFFLMVTLQLVPPWCTPTAMKIFSGFSLKTLLAEFSMCLLKTQLSQGQWMEESN